MGACTFEQVKAAKTTPGKKPSQSSSTTVKR
jgi:Ca2+-binding EF-hand superfamily protein